MSDWLFEALHMGFTAAAELDPAVLKPLPAIREMCAADRCRAYGKNWTCPPAVGTLEECAARLRKYRKGLLVQTVGRLHKVIDTKAMEEAEQRHLQLLHGLAYRIRQEQPAALCLGAGGCRICKSCAYPEPCRFPERACSSMEAYGLFVTQVCRDCGLPYHYGAGTISFTACVLLSS